MPLRPFYLLGMGRRTKLLYRGGELLDALTGAMLRSWEVVEEHIDPAEYRVSLEIADGLRVVLSEDGDGVWLDDGSERECLDAIPMRLHRFEDRRNPALMRRLYHELLINIVDGKPVPNLFVYPKPWYRDAAMVVLCLERTGDIGLVADWIAMLRDPFDRNNAGTPEPDNLGQLLTMISCVSDQFHPLVATILRMVPDFRRGNHITGLTDFGEHPVYQTKWLKYGLRRMRLDDPFEIPAVEDSYSAIFWMDYRDAHVESPGFGPATRRNYPYLAWAEAHFHHIPVVVEDSGYPLTWEAHASQANYSKMGIVAPEYVDRRRCEPHSWHAAEMFLYHWERN